MLKRFFLLLLVMEYIRLLFVFRLGLVVVIEDFVVGWYVFVDDCRIMIVRKVGWIVVYIS